MKKTCYYCCVLMVLSLQLVWSPSSLHAQRAKKYDHDSTYYDMFPDKLTVRVFMSQKFVYFDIPPSSSSFQEVKYKANAKLNTGIGVTWHNVTLNLAYGFSGLNKTADKGKTTGLDLQLHTFPHKWSVDFLVVMPKGMYLSPKGYAAANSSSYYVRPDVKERIFGLAAYHVPNKEKFSYRAALVQNEWQKKSAGSLLYGGEAYYVIMEGDSAMVPKAIQSGFATAGVTEMRFIDLAPGIGYAYTAVMNRHFFITGSLVGNVDISLSTEEKGTTAVKKSTVNPSFAYKGAIGYNSDNWAIAASITGNAFFSKSASTSSRYFTPAGGFKIALSKKFLIRKEHPTRTK